MISLSLTRSADDRRLYVLDGVGSLRLEGVSSRRATAEAAGRSWAFGGRGLWRRGIEATDAAGGEAGSFSPRALRRGGTVIWDGRSFELRSASRWRERYALAEGGREFAVFDAKSWGRRPVEVSLDREAQLEPGLVLFAAFIARRLASDAAASASMSASASASVL